MKSEYGGFRRIGADPLRKTAYGFHASQNGCAVVVEAVGEEANTESVRIFGELIGRFQRWTDYPDSFVQHSVADFAAAYRPLMERKIRPEVSATALIISEGIIHIANIGNAQAALLPRQKNAEMRMLTKKGGQLKMRGTNATPFCRAESYVRGDVLVIATSVAWEIIRYNIRNDEMLGILRTRTPAESAKIIEKIIEKWSDASAACQIFRFLD